MKFDDQDDVSVDRAATNPAGPLGLQQTATAIGEQEAAYQQSLLQGVPGLQPWKPKESWLETAQTWYTGANREGTQNGWDSTFWRQAQSNIDNYYTKATETGKGSTFFQMLSHPGATGVAMWDDPDGRYKFGDVFLNGQKAKNDDGSDANLYTDYDKATADVMMGEFMFTRDEKARIFADPNRDQEMADKVAERRQQWSDMAKYGPQAEQYQADVAAQKAEFREGAVDDLGSIALGAGGGAAASAGTAALITAAAAAAGFSWTGPGALLAAVIGGTVGGLTAWMNKDAISDLAARAYVDTERAWEYSNNPVTTVGAGIANAAKVATRASSPLSNFYQGLHDITSPKGWGDPEGDVGYYRVDALGDREVGGALQAVDIAASLGDMALQFSSKAAAKLYFATMSGAITGGVTDQVMGARFNPRIGAYDPFDTGGERASALGSTGIDVAQMGMARFLGSAAASAKAAAGGSAVEAGWLTNKLNSVADRGWRDMRSKDIVSYETINGIRFGLDDNLNVVGSRMTLQALVPSEFMRWLPTTWLARRNAMNRPGSHMVTRDDMYEAAWTMTSKGSNVRNAIINSYAEGAEEFVQAILDPWSVSESPQMGDIVAATLYGAAGGAGMSLGRLNTRPGGDAFSKERAFKLMTMRLGREPDRETFNEVWNNASPMDKRRMSTLKAAEEKEMNAILDSYAELMAMNATYDSVIGVNNLSNLSRSAFEAAHKKAASEGQGSLVLMPMAAGTIVLPGGGREALEYAANAAAMSAHQTGLELAGIAKGMGGQLAALQQQQDGLIEDLKALEGAQGENADVERAGLQKRIEDIGAMIADISATIQFSDQVVQWFGRWLDAYRKEPDRERRREMVREINVVLRNAGKGQWQPTNGEAATPEAQEAVRRSVELSLARHPFMNEGSFGIFIPQVSFEMTENNIHSTVYMHHSTLKAPGADHDGDTGVVQHEKYLTPADRLNKRRGAQYIETNTVSGDPAKPSAAKAVVDMPDNEARLIRLFHEALADLDSQAAGVVSTHLTSLIDYLRNTLRESTGGAILDSRLDPLLAEFKDGIVAGNPQAREKFLNDLLNVQPNAVQSLLQMADSNPELDGMPFIPWFMWTVNFKFDMIQRELATRIQTDPTSVIVGESEPLKESVSAAYLERIAVRDAQTAGQQLMATIDPTRAAQQLHYSAIYRALTITAARDVDQHFTTDEQYELVRLYAELGSGVVASELDMTLSKDSIERNVMTFLRRIVDEANIDNPAPMPELMLLMANMAVPDIRPSKEGGYYVETGTTTLLQILLRKALEIEENKLTNAPVDAAARLRINKLRTLAYPKKDGHSYTASKAIVELFGHTNLYDLVGDTSMFLGSEMTLAQLVKLTTGMSSRQQDQFFHNLKRSSGYIKDSEVKDPPWPAEDMTAGRVNAFAILIDAVKVYVDTEAGAMEGREATMGKDFRDALTRLDNMIERHMAEHGKRLPAGDRVAALRDLLKTDRRVVTLLSDLIPEGASLGVFTPLDTGEVRQANWLEYALTMKDKAKAELIIYTQLKFAEFNSLGGTVRTDIDDQGEERSTRGSVRYDKIDSRFLQTVYHLALDPTGQDMIRFLKAIDTAPSLDALFEQINEREPNWLNDRARLLPYHDDVALFEARPQDIWQEKLPYALQREAMELFATGMEMIEDSAFERAETFKANRDVTARMLEVAEGRSTDPRYVSMYDQLGELISHRQHFPDSIGPRARDQLLELFTEALIKLHDKGKIDDAARGFGESLVTMDSFGWKGALMQEADALTSMDWNDIATNLTALVKGPLRIQWDDGSETTLDMSNRESALRLLHDPRTQQFAMAVLDMTVRDVNSHGMLQTYRDSGVRNERTNSIERMLAPEALRLSVFDSQGSQIEQAWRYIGLLEANMRSEALNSPQGDTVEELEEYVARNDAAHHPIQNLIDDFLIAYTTGPRWSKAEKRKLRDKLVIQVADAIKSMANVTSEQHGYIKDVIVGALQEQFTGGTEGLDLALMPEDDKKFLIASLRVHLSKVFAAEIGDLTNKRLAELEGATTDAEREIITKKYDAMEAAINERYARYQVSDDEILQVPGVMSATVESIINSTRLTGEPAADLPRKVQILDILGKANRTNRFRQKADIELYRKVRRILFESGNMALFRDATDPNQVTGIDDITLDEWNILGGWAAASMISDMTSRSGSEVALLPLIFEPSGELVRRYYDVSWGYLVEAFFDPQLMVAAKKLATQANAKRPVDSKAMIQQFMNGLFADGNLGQWNDRVPIESLKLRRVVDSASTGAAIQTEGNDPKALAAYIAAGRVSSKLPDPAKHHSVQEYTGLLGSGLLNGLPHANALVGRFASSVTLDVSQLPPEIQQSIDPEDLNLFRLLAKNEFNDEVRDSPYRVINLQNLGERLDELAEAYGELPGVTIRIEYVDVDKLPSGPNDLDWTNNIFFVGIGREGYRTSTFGGLAALYFGSNGLSKLGQQNPLDAATKKGKRYRANITPVLNRVLQAEAAGQTVSQILWNKVDIMAEAHYPTGDLLVEDLPALYELMKMRHVVVGINAAGDREVWWPQRLIEMETNGITPPLTDIKLVPLNDSIAQQLHTGRTAGGLRTRVTQRELNLQDVVPFASLNAQRLKDLGITRLGVEADVWDTPLTQVGSLAQASLVREDIDRTNTIVERIRRWHAHREAVLASRSRTRREGSGRFDPKRINKDNLSKLNSMLQPDVVSSLMRRLGVPFADLETDQFSLTKKMLRRVRSKAEKQNSNAVIWYHDQESGTDPGKGILGKDAVNSDFAPMGDNLPTYGDVVAINISSIERENKENTIEAAKAVIRSYTKLGLTVVLTVDNGRRDTLSQLNSWLDAGSEGYRAVAGSMHFYSPIDDDPLDGETRRALNSTLTNVRAADTAGIALGLVTNELGSYLSENGGAADLRWDPGWKRVVANIIPSRILGSGSVGKNTKYSFAYPSEDDSRQWSNIRDILLPLLQTEAGLNHLTALASGGKGKKDGNPKDTPLYREIPETGERIPGVLDMRTALIQLRNILESGDQPLTPGRKLQVGSIIPSIGLNNQILLNRVGFLPPDMLRMSEMLAAPLGSNTGSPGTEGLNIAVAPARLDKDATIGPVFTVKEVKTTSRGLTVIGDADLSGYSKTILEGTGFKMGAVPMPSSLRFKDVVMKAGKGIGMRLTRLLSETSLISKEATPGLVDNFADAFVVAGMSFQNDLMEFFYGSDVLKETDESRAVKWDKLRGLLIDWSHMDHGMTAEELAKLLDKDFGQGMLQQSINDFGSEAWQGAWRNVRMVPSNLDEQTNARIASIILVTLAAPGVRLDHVLDTSGLITVESHDRGLGVMWMPALMTDALADSAYPEVRNLLIGRMNSRMPSSEINPDKKLYWFDEALNFHALLEEQVDGQWTDREVVGQLQIQLPVVHDVTGDTLAYAALTADQTMSPHVVNVQNASEGSYLVPKGKKLDRDGNAVDALPDRVDEIFGDNEILRFEAGDGAVVWDMLTRVMASDPSFSPWERPLPFETVHRNQCDAKVRYYTQPIEKPENTDDWAPAVKNRAIGAATEILEFLGLNIPSTEANLEEIDYLVRQWYGAPAAENAEQVEAAKISAEEYYQAARTMLQNLKQGLHPLHSADVPLEHVMFWRKVYEAQRSRPAKDRWAPVRMEKPAKGRRGEAEQVRATDWADWVATVIGQTMDSKEAFDGIFSNALDGFYHTYQGSTPDFLTTALSLDEQKAARLRDPETNRTYLSVNGGWDAVLADPIVLDSVLLTYEVLAGQQPEFNDLAASKAETSPRAKRRERQAEYREKNKITKQRETTVREYARDGLWFQESHRKTSELLSGMVNLSISMRLANPALYVSALIEVPFRNMLERSANLLSGTYTGIGAGALSNTAEKMGLTPRYSAEEHAVIDMLVKRLGESNLLLGEIFHDMVYARPMDAKSKGGRALENVATKISRATSDPRWGMKANSAARRYVEGALNYLEMTGSAITVQQFAELMNRNPLWLMQQYGQDAQGLNAHKAGVNAVAQVRSMRPTVTGRAIMSPIDRMTESGSVAVNVAGHLLKLPFMFTRFNVNMLMTLTGLDALDQVAAMMMDGRQSNGLMKRLGALSRRVDSDPESARRMDYSDVMQGIDLSRIFARSAVTQTGLMAAALMAAGRGLGGEDEEERRRRKIATYLNLPYIRDPRKANNDFRFRDAVFLDNVPLLDTWFHRDDIDRSVVQPHWILRQFLSPVLGTMRFFETGDLEEIRSGFWDAAAALPNSVLGLWREADATGTALAAAAADASLDPQKEQQTNQFIINFVGMYEKALIENQFVNSLRQAMDPIDRNPWLVPMTANENTGELDRTQGANLPQETNALVDVVTDGSNGQDPTIRKAYLTRETSDAQLHAYAENNTSFALLASLLTGGSSSSFLRRNMVPKTRTAYTDEATKAEAEAAILSAFEGAGGQPARTHREILQTLRDRETKLGHTWDNAKLEEEATAIYEAESKLAFRSTIFDKDALNVLNHDAEFGMYKSLHAGAVHFGDPVTAGFWVGPEMRDAIAKEWLEELVEEGMALGLTQDSAKYRADRFWWGDSREGWIGLRELIYSNKIPRSGQANYLQQNVTYVIGPDGKPWATPFEKSNILGTVLPVPRELVDPGPGLALDKRGNVIDLTRNINTGLAGLLQTPSDPQNIKPNDKILDDVKKKDFGDKDPTYRKFSRFPSRGYGGSSYGPNFSRMLPLPDSGFSVRPDSIPFINTSAPYVRRARINTERITSDRGRLKQWQ